MRTAVLIPARNETEALPHLFAALRRAGWAARGDAHDAHDGIQVIVVDNGSDDATAEVACAAGAHVIQEPRAGYGRACLAGMAWLRRAAPETLVFLDADDFLAARQLPILLQPLEDDEADMVIGERSARGGPGVFWHARLGNLLILALLRWLYGSPVRDMGPFRAVRWSTIESLSLDDTSYGWFVQMQVRALRAGCRVRGEPVRFRRRTVGRSKVSGSIRASIRASWVMLLTLAVEVTRRSPPRPSSGNVTPEPP